MPNRTQQTEGERPLWHDDPRPVFFPAIDQQLEVDVVIAGGGITGLTAAILLASEGQRVALLEADRIGAGTSGATSAQVSSVPDIGYRTLLARWGAAAGTEYVVRLNAALELMDSLVIAERIVCDWRRVPGYWFTEDEVLDRLRAEQQAAQQLGQSCRLLRSAPLPWGTAGAIEFDDQALFHPMRYLAGLARIARARGARLFEDSPVTAWRETGDGVVVETPAAQVRARGLILATHSPLGVNPVQTELRAVQSHIVALTPREEFPDALFWDTDDPYHYLRPAIDSGRPVVLVGGGDHKTGHGDIPAIRAALLDDYVRPRFGDAAVSRWWSAQLFEPADGLPYIGRSPAARHVYLATGFAGVGLVQGTMAATELAAQIGGEQREGPWKPNRLSLSAAPRLVSDGVDAARCWIGDRLHRPSPGSPQDLAPGEGELMDVDGRRCAVFRDDAGAVHVLSPVCPHLGCLVRWNGTARSWDCPCHGSRFAATGEVLEGPALAGLERVGDAPVDERPSVDEDVRRAQPARA